MAYGTLIRIGAGTIAPPAVSWLVLPIRVRPSDATAITFLGTGTAWLSTPPAITAVGLADGLTLGAVTVLDDVTATAILTTGPDRGPFTWHEANAGLTYEGLVGFREPIQMLVPAPSFVNRAVAGRRRRGR